MDIERFAGGLDEAVDEGALADDESAHGAERRVARTWLHLLGYLKNDNDKTRLDGDLIAALKAFRTDLGVASVEDDLDVESWTMLKRLMSFDPEDNSGERFSGFSMQSPALVRAVCVRLYALDLMNDLPKKILDTRAMDGALKNFAHAYRLLKLTRLEPAVTHETVKALFENTTVISRLRSEDQGLTLSQPGNSTEDEREANWKLIKEYVNAIARIELWLIGYIVRPRKRMRARESTNDSLKRAIRVFWQDQPEAARPPKREIENLDRRFFDRVVFVMGHGEEREQEQDAEISEQLLTDPELAKMVKKEAKGLGARIFDGVKRAVKFVVGWIAMGLRRLVTLARNLARVVIERVGHVFAAVRDVMLALRDSWRFLTTKPIPGSDREHLIVIHDKDFDFCLVRNPEADPGRVTDLALRVAGMSGLLASSCAFVGHLVEAFVEVGRRAAMGGWFAILLTLLKVRQWIEQMAVIVTEIRRQRKWLESLDAQVVKPV